MTGAYFRTFLDTLCGLVLEVLHFHCVLFDASGKAHALLLAVGFIREDVSRVYDTHNCVCHCTSCIVLDRYIYIYILNSDAIVYHTPFSFETISGLSVSTTLWKSLEHSSFALTARSVQKNKAFFNAFR